MLLKKTNRYNVFGLAASLIFLGCASAQAQKAASPVDDVAKLTATMVLKAAFQKGPQLPVEAFVLADKGKIRVMRASTTAQVCIVKIERDDVPNAVGWAVREKLCWER